MVLRPVGVAVLLPGISAAETNVRNQELYLYLEEALSLNLQNVDSNAEQRLSKAALDST